MLNHEGNWIGVGAIAILFISILLNPISYSFAAPRPTILTLDSVHNNYHVGEEIEFNGKLVDSQRYMLYNELVEIRLSNFPFGNVIGTGITDARGNFVIRIPAELWNGDGKQVSFVAHYDGSDKYEETTSKVIISEMRKLYTPLGKEQEYENLKEEGYFEQKSAPKEQTQSQQDQSSFEKEISGVEKSVDEIIDGDLGGGCLIATATYGTELASQVQQLRELRDNTLLQTNSGTSFMSGFNQLYYSFSPTIADMERENPLFKEVLKLTITPLLTSLSILNYVDINSEEEMLGYGISLIMLNVGMYFVAPVILIHSILRKVI